MLKEQGIFLISRSYYMYVADNWSKQVNTSMNGNHSVSLYVPITYFIVISGSSRGKDPSFSLFSQKI